MSNRLQLPKGAPRPRKAIQAMAPYSPPTGARIGKLRFDFNENTVGCSPRVLAAIQKELTAERLSIYPDYDETRPALAKFFGVDPEQVVITNGTDEAIQVLVNTYLDDGDEAVMLKPAYAMYKFYCQVAGAKVVEVPYPSADLAFPLDSVLKAITPSTRAVLIANPNNPTGTAAPIEAIERILRRARKAVVLIDEAYFEFCGITALPLIERYPNLFVSRTFSKIFGLAAMRVGALLSQAGNAAAVRRGQSPYSVNQIAAIAVREAVKDTAHVQNFVGEVLAARELLKVGLELLAIPYIESQANFILMKLGKRSIEIRDKLRAKNVLVRDRSYEIAGCVRVTVGTREQTRRFLTELEEIW